MAVILFIQLIVIWINSSTDLWIHISEVQKKIINQDRGENVVLVFTASNKSYKGGSQRASKEIEDKGGLRCSIK